MKKGEHGGYPLGEGGKEIRYFVMGFSDNETIVEQGYLSDIFDGFDVQDLLDDNKNVKTFRPIREKPDGIEECLQAAKAYAEKLNRAWLVSCELKRESGNN
ncbi:MAG: hypothetical protein ABSD79_00670 [Dehalococcoidales bacterium]|jgi:hypothetical protein